MGADCSSCGCNDQQEFKMHDVQLDDRGVRKSNAYGAAGLGVSTIPIIVSILTILSCFSYSQPLELLDKADRLEEITTSPISTCLRNTFDRS